MDKGLNSFEDILKQKGFLIYTNQGSSMLPLIREGKDVSVISSDVSDIKCRDIVLAKRPSGRYLLHRIIRINSDGTYSICGDNSYKCDNNIKKSDIIGKLTTIITNNKRNDLNGIWYKLYSYCWSNLFFIRKPLLIITKLQFNIWNTKSIKICRLKKL